MEENTLLEVKDLRVVYKTDEATVHAVNGISFTLGERETIGLVGETGAGKTTTALTLLRLLPERTGRVLGGEIRFRGENLLEKTIPEMRHVRGAEISIIFQDPMTALNPALTVGDQVLESLETEIKYAGYIDKQTRQVAQFRALENRKLPRDMDYLSIQGLRIEARQKLNDIRPASLGQASRISGVSPADITTLMVYLESHEGQK